MRWSPQEPTLDEILSDPIVAAVMQADAVDANALDEMLSEIAAQLTPRAGASTASSQGRSR